MSTRYGRKRSRDDKHSYPAKRFRGGKKLLRTRLEIPPLCELTATPVQRAVHGGRTTTVGVSVFSVWF